MPSRTEQHVTHAAERMPSELMAAMAMVQRACAKASRELEQVNPGMAQVIDLATAQIISDPCAALHVAASVGVAHNLLPALAGLSAELALTTHLKAPEGQALADHAAQLLMAQQAIMSALPCAHQLVMHQSTSRQVREQVATALTHTLRLPFISAADTVTSASAIDHLVGLHGALQLAATALNKIAEAMRNLHPDQQGATQCDALAMVCRQVMGNDIALVTKVDGGQLEGHPFKPLVARQLLQSIRLLTDATTVFTEYFVRGITVSRDRIAHGLASSLMLVTSKLTLETV
ncbi:MAG: lyase family protein [Aquabacterium sp.]|uniref:lyase family protein n=1 Tax=Aquabacterium sp. TaxID=1872578 RepID=UPI00271B164D|nr:lyase family protein [Aquabacterium sp.]MDO9004415.1 lyase family protein [Aquabacterium sp.]